jgi:hypothetical protein
VLVAGATIGASAALAASADAATYTVTTNGDTTTPSAANCTGASPTFSCPTLRDALTAANGDGSADTIDFGPGVTSPITLGTAGVLPISGSGGLTIQGPGAGSLAIDAHPAFQVFDITSPAGTSVTISGLTLEHGTATSGGAIVNATGTTGGSSLSLIDSVISGSVATSGGGGGIESDGPLTVTGSTITGNTSSSDGGGIDMVNNGPTKYDLTITDSTISGNTVQSGAGGGVFGGAKISISGSQITGNRVLGPSQSSYSGGGVAASAGSLSVTNTTVSGNTGTGLGGGILADTKYGTTISGSTVSGNSSAGGGGVEVLQEKSDEAEGGAQNPTSVQTSKIFGNHATNGAGIEIEPVATSGGFAQANPVTVQASTISGNQGGTGSFGGGLLVLGTQYDPIDVLDSTISGNSASNGGGVSLGNGGTTPLLSKGSNGSISFDNSTIDGNSADTAGGGIYLGQYSTGSPATEQSATADINSTIVAGNTGAGSPNDLYRPTTSTSGGFNDAFSLIQTPGNAPLLSSQALITGVDPQLNPLADNGGPTETMLPKDTSPVIDQGLAKSGLTTDQRGDPRTVDNGKPRPPGGDGTDIGAVELAKIPPSPPPPPPPPPPAKSISATVDPASGITNTSATLNGAINTDGLAVTWHFEYGTTTGGAKDAQASRGNDPETPTQSISAGHGNVPVSFKVSGLKPGTRYSYHVVAVSSAGQTVSSTDATFTTAKPTLKVHPGAARAGHEVRLFGSAGACTRGSRVTLISGVFSPAHKYHGHNAVYAKVGKGFKYSVVTQIPAGRNPARYAITARCDGAAFGVTAFLRVLPPPAVIRFTA